MAGVAAIETYCCRTFVLPFLPAYPSKCHLGASYWFKYFYLAASALWDCCNLALICNTVQSIHKYIQFICIKSFFIFMYSILLPFLVVSGHIRKYAALFQFWVYLLWKAFPMLKICDWCSYLILALLVLLQSIRNDGSVYHLGEEILAFNTGLCVVR
jgi:hypothetical protein